ncbi:MAG TPA: TolC family protein [Candidatus Dormibacteraeota bacterium]|nr:TolC family protein [Candidatus Dormibacteraeota bacterium]
MGNSLRLEVCAPLGNKSCLSAGRTSINTRPLILGICMVFAILAPATIAVAQESAPATAEIQMVQPSAPSPATPPIKITLQDALERARKIDPMFLGASLDAKIAHEDRLQARNAMLPTITATSQYLGTQGDGGKISDGRFVTNDGIHIYRDWGVLRQDLSPALLMGTGYKRAKAEEALAKAKIEIARRGLTVTVSRNFYALVVAQRKVATAQQGLAQANHFMSITQDAERQGQSPHSDALKAEIQARIQQQAFDEARLALEDARLNLAVLLFPKFDENFTVVDDLDSAQALPSFSEVQAMAEKENPDLRVATQTLKASSYDVTSAKTAFLPTLTVETDYGIEANCFALRCARSAFPEVGPVPNLGYFLTAALNLPVWDWGTLRSKLHQARYKEQQAKTQLSQTQRQLVAQLYAAYNEAAIARASIARTQHTADLAAESLRLTNLRYTGGVSPATEVVDAENMLVQAKNSYIDAEARYRAALANLQTLTGNF